MPRRISSMPLYVSIFSVLIVALAASGFLRAEEKKETPSEEKITYDDHVQPILRKRCFACHNADTQKGGLNMTSISGLMQGGGSGEVIEPSSAEDSYLYMLITGQSEPAMPPGGGKIPEQEIATIAKWIDGGALANAGSKPIASKKKKFDFALKGAPIGKPEGPPPMPGRLSLEPIVHTKATTAVTALATSPWAPLVAVGGQKQVLLYHSQSLELLGVLPFPEGVPKVLKFSSNGSLLLAGGGHASNRGLAIVWNVKTGERLFEVGDELDTVLAADISADQTRIALGGPNRIVRIYSTSDGKLLHELRKHTDWIYSISFSPDGVLLATGDRNGGLFVWEAYSAREYLSLRAHSAGVTALSWRADANILASSSEDGSVRLWEMENGGNVKGWGAHGGGAASVEFTRDGRVVSCGRDKLTKLWDQSGKQLLAFPALGDIALRVTHCDESNRVISGDWTGAIRVWNAADGQHVGDLTTNPQVLAARLDEATKLVPTREAEAKQLAEAYQTAQAAADKIQADLNGATNALAEAQKQGEQAAATAKQAKEEIAKLTAEKEAAAKQVAALDPVVSPLKEAAEKSQQAVEKAPEDKELAAAATQMKVQFDKKAAALAAEQKIVAERTATLEKTQQQLTAAEKQVVDYKAAADAAQKQIDTIKPTLQPAVDQAAAAKAASDAAAQSFSSAQVAVARWQDEIGFVKKLKELAVHEANFNQLATALEVEQVNVDKAKGELAAANAQVEQAQKESETAATTVKQSQDALTKAGADEAETTKGIAALEPVIPLLKETFEKGQQTSEKAAGDKEVADAVAGLKALFDKKTADLEAARKTLAERKTIVAKATETLAAAEKLATEKNAALEAARKVAADKTAVLKPVEEKLAAAQAAADAAKAQVDQAKAALEVPLNLDKARAEAS